ncbi:MAG: asparaginase [Alphaproteobacteria bacterium]|nr:asparaginase [Alphaproteobacteria bacterium]
MTTHDPILVEVIRGGMVESYHRGSMVIMNAKGSIMKSWGDPDKKIYARSALKLLQALPLIETGAANAFNISDKEITLACASHSSAREHIDSVNAWLKRLGLSSSDLECGIYHSMGKSESEALCGGPITTLDHPCSGNHTGFLSTALHMKEPLKGYIERNHLVQKRVETTISEMAEIDLSSIPTGIDGCGIPVYGFPLKNLALAMAKFANPEGLPPKRMDAIRKMIKAIQQNPKMLAGENRFDTALIEATQGEVIIKGGVEGVYIAIIPSLGYGAALKISDGSVSGAEIACGALLQQLGLLSDNAQSVLSHFLHPKIVNQAGKIVGERRPVFC